METSNNECITATVNQEDENECNSSSIFVDKPSSRRVSFASTNFVKQFAVDPEKNTIWDATYEEKVTSDSTHSSENAHGSLSAQPTCPRSILHSLNHDMTTSVNCYTDRGEDMECDFTLIDYMMNKENVALGSNNVFSSNKESARSLPMCINTELPRTNFMVNKTVLNNTCMEMTQGVQFINNNLKARSLSNITLRNMDETMDYTQCIVNENNIKYGYNQENATMADNISMEHTCQIPTSSNNDLGIDRTIIDNASMDLTTGIDTNEVIFGGPRNLSPSIMEQTVPITDFKLKQIYVRSNAGNCSHMDLSQNVIMTNPHLSQSSFTVQKDADTDHTVPMDVIHTQNATLKTIQYAPNDLHFKLSDSDMKMDKTTPITPINLNMNLNLKHEVPDQNNYAIPQFNDIREPKYNDLMLDEVNGDSVEQKMQTHKAKEKLLPKVTIHSCNANLIPIPTVSDVSHMKCAKDMVQSDSVIRNIKPTLNHMEFVNESKINTIDVILANDETIHSTHGRKSNCPTSELINLEVESKPEALAERCGNKTIHDHQNKFVFGNIQNLPQEVGIKDLRLDDNFSLNANRDTVYAKMKCKKILDKSVDVLENNFEKSSNEIKLSKEVGSESIEVNVNKSSSIKLLESTEKNSSFKQSGGLYLDKPIVCDRITKIDEQNILFNSSNNMNAVGNMCDSTLTASVKVSPSEKLIKIENVETKRPKYLFALSPYSDDTQHLINYNLSADRQSKSDFSKLITGDLNSSFINSKVMALSDFSCDTLPTSLNNTRNITKDSNKKGLAMQATYIIDATLSKGQLQDEEMSSSNAQLSITSESNAKHCESLQTVNIFQENLSLIENSYTSITDAEMSNFNSDSAKVNELWDSYLIDHKAMDPSIQEYKNKLKKHKVIKKYNTTKLQHSCKTQMEVMNQFFKEFKVTEFQDKHSHIESKMSSSHSRENLLPLQTSNDFSQSSIEILTYEEQIRRQSKRSKNYWTIISMDDGLCQIHTFYKTLRLEVKFDTLSGIVLKTEIYDCIAGTSDPTGFLVHKNFKNRLSERNIQSGVGEKYDILTLLDYVHITMQKMLNILDEFSMFSKRFNFKMDKHFMGTFWIVNLQLRSTWTFSVDMSDLENISEKSINIATNSSKICEKEIKKLINRTSGGLTFLKKFLKDVTEYIDLCAIQKQG